MPSLTPALFLSALLLAALPVHAITLTGLDSDADGVDDAFDNCTLVANPDQRDTDSDGFGNYCDPDLNNDDAVNFTDLGLLKERFFSADPDADFNGDGAVNFADLGIIKARFFGRPGPGAPVITDGEYVLHGDPLFPRALHGGGSPERIVLSGGLVSIPGACDAIAGVFDTRSQVVVVTADWPRCGPSGEPARLEVSIDKLALGSLIGKITIGNSPPKIVVATKGFGASVRMLSYNVQMLPSFFSATTDPENGKRISKRIKASGYDVVVLNEVFDEDVREVFLDELETAFPYHVDYLSGGTFPHEDSALMLFSRFPFEPLPLSTFQVTLPFPPPFDIGTGICTGTDCTRVAYLEFQECDDDDCLAEKGVGFVRLRNPDNDAIYNVAFTHMQASYPPFDYPASTADLGDAQDQYLARKAQMEDIQAVLEGTLLPNQLQNEAVLVLGDLNIDGDLADPDLGYDRVNEENLYEWQQRLGSGAGFFYDKLREVWANYNAPVHPSGNYDRGLTNVSAWGEGSDGARLDHILLGVGGRQCAQHTTLSHNLRWSPSNGVFIETGLGPNGIGLGGTQDLSDHYGLNIDLNLDAARCRPTSAEIHDPAPGSFTAINGNIAHPGAVQWYRFDSAGTWSFEFSSAAGADYRIYEGIDLTTPAPQYKQELTEVISAAGLPFEGEQYRIAHAPFYLKVFHPDRKATGSFTVKALRHDCATRATACALGPGQRYDHTLADMPPLNGPDEAWFELYTEALPGAQVQALEFFASEIVAGGNDYFDLDLYREDAQGMLELLSTDTSPSADPAPQNPGRQMLNLGWSDGQRTKYYLVVRRSSPLPPPYPAAANAYQMRWQTNLTILFGASKGGQALQIRCLEENDPAIDDGDDEIYIESVRADGTEIVGLTDLGDFDAGNQRSLENVIPTPIFFVGSVQIDGFEDDGFLNGDADPMSATIQTLPSDTPGPVKRSVSLYPDGGLYKIYYNLTHGFDD